MLTWPELCKDRPHALNASAAVSTGAKVVVLGYMMDDHRLLRTSELVSSFLLLPEAGNLLHPAHRLADQMIEVHLRAGREVAFSNRHLVRLSGVLRQRAGDPSAERALYILDDSEVELIQRAEIRKYYR